ncbi:MAG: hypothetical protein WAX79_07175 [Candidatus Omnitrophota bacterium]
MATPQEITDFLKKFKHVLSVDITFIPRRDNVATIAYLGITIAYVKTILSQLTYKDYIRGPLSDKDKHGNMLWEFGTHIQGEDIYIKLSDDFNFNKAKCISFHIATYSLVYPYKKN